MNYADFLTIQKKHKAGRLESGTSLNFKDAPIPMMAQNSALSRFQSQEGGSLDGPGQCVCLYILYTCVCHIMSYDSYVLHV